MADAPAELGASLGAELRAAREARKLTVHKVAQEMHVGDDIIERLEQDDYAALGAPIFVHGHLRNYAHLLDLPEDEVLAKYDHATGRLAPPPLVTQHGDAAGRLGRRVGMPAVSVVVIAVLVVLAVIWWQHRAPVPSASMAAQTDAVTGANPQSVSPAAVTPATAEPLKSSQAGTVPPLPAHAQGANVHTRTPVVSVAQPAPRPPAATQPAGPTHIVEGGVPASQLVHAQFVVQQASWIEVYDAAGKRLFYNLAPAGDDIDISGAGPLQVFLGNAPGVSVEYNGTAFNAAPFTQASNNTARFKLGSGPANGQPTG
jgi:cytoskeleton protein RodZ